MIERAADLVTDYLGKWPVDPGGDRAHPGTRSSCRGGRFGSEERAYQSHP